MPNKRKMGQRATKPVKASRKLAPVVRGPQLSIGAVAGLVPKPRPLPGAPKLTTKQERAIRAKERQVLNEYVTYRQQFVDCRKAECKRCAPEIGRTKRRPSHGPYWYSEDSQPRRWDQAAGRYVGGKTRTKYIGKRLSPEIAAWVARVGTEEARAAASMQIAEDADGDE